MKRGGGGGSEEVWRSTLKIAHMFGAARACPHCKMRRQTERLKESMQYGRARVYGCRTLSMAVVVQYISFINFYYSNKSLPHNQFLY